MIFSGDIDPPLPSTIPNFNVSRKRPFDNTTHSSTNNINNLKSDKSYSEIVGNKTHSNSQKIKFEIFESKKYPGKYFYTDSKTNNSVWVEILNNNPEIRSQNIFNVNSNIADFHFLDAKNEKCEIAKASFAPK